MFRFNDLIAHLRIEIGDDSEFYEDDADYDEENEEDEHNWWDHPLSEYEEGEDYEENDEDYEDDDEDGEIF